MVLKECGSVERVPYGPQSKRLLAVSNKVHSVCFGAKEIAHTEDCGSYPFHYGAGPYGPWVKGGGP